MNNKGFNYLDHKMDNQQGNTEIKKKNSDFFKAKYNIVLITFFTLRD